MNYRAYMCLLSIVAVSIIGVHPSYLAAQNVWTETTQEDFRDGFFDRDIYASQRDGGTVEFSLRWDLNNDEYIDIPMARNFGDLSYVYWGSASGYSSSNMGVYPQTDCGECAIADVNHDGYPELFFVSGYNYVRMFYGTATGPDPYNYNTINIPVWNKSCFIADYNKDGNLDMAVSAYYSGYGVVFYGDGSGNFAIQDSFISTYGLGNIEVADFNKDSWLDLVSLNGYNSMCSIYFGSEDGFDDNNRIDLPRPSGYAGPVSIADLNEDSNLDLILTSWGGGTSYLYTGHDSTFQLWTTLNPGRCWGGSSIADFNNDAYLDILYMKGQTVNEQPYIYWGSASGYSDANRTAIGAPDDISGALIADYNADSILDIFLYNFDDWDDSYFLYGPDYLTPFNHLPGDRLGHNWRREIGNIYDREYYEEYVSSWFDAGEETAWGIIEWDEELPPGSSIRMFIRSGPTTCWSDWYEVTNGSDIPDSYDTYCLQYKAEFHYTNPAYLPSLSEVRVFYESTESSDITNKQEETESNSIPLKIFCDRNPVKDQVLFTIRCVKDDATAVRIYDVNGKLIDDLGTFDLLNNSVSIAWDIKDRLNKRVTGGVYFVAVHAGNYHVVKKIVVLD